MSTASPARMQAARINGARSRGPKTPEGKLRAAGNRCTHGFYSQRLILKSESQAEFDRLLASYTSTIRPANPAESLHVRQLAEARWLLERAHYIQEEIISEASLNLPNPSANPFQPGAQALERVIATSQFQLAFRAEGRYSRRYHQALTNLLTLRARSHTKNAGSNPSPTPQTENAGSNPTPAPHPQTPHPTPPTKNEDSNPAAPKTKGPRHSASAVQGPNFSEALLLATNRDGLVVAGVQPRIPPRLGATPDRGEPRH